jgi:hypothetical protein
LQLCLSGCCICFTHMLHVFYSDIVYCCNGFQMCVSSVFSSVSESCFKCFICLQMYVAIVASRCFKVDQRCLHVAMALVAGGQRLVAWLRLLPHAAHLALSYLSPPLPSLSFSPSRCNSLSSSLTWSSVAL